MTEFTVTKRDGRRESRNDEKINKMLGFAEEGLTNVSASEVALKSQIHFHDGIKTEDIQVTLIKTAADLISEFQPDYSLFAGRLNIIHLRKMAYGGNDVPHLYTHVQEMCRRGIYDGALVNDYNAHEWNELDSYIDHDKDFGLHYAATVQMQSKYLVQNRVTGDIYESPQILYMLVAACLFSSYPKESRLDYVKRFYDFTSDGKLSLPTPIMAGVRTPTRQFSSCVLIECGDSLNSINATSSAIVKYVSQRAGIGINAGRIRALGSPIRNGEAHHTGCIPFYKHFQTAVKSCSQGGVRGGAATLFYPMWHLEVESLLVLKNNKGVDENRVRHIDYGVQLNKTMYQRLIDGGNITLLSPDVYDGALYDAYFADQKEFERLYEKAEKDESIKKKVVKAVDLFGSLATERAQTGRIYINNVDHCNELGPFKPEVAPVKQSNLCVAPETQILTDNGYQVISELQDQKVNVWNGKEWSEVEIKKTGVGQKLVTVKTNSTKPIDCTEYHKFYLADGYKGKILEKRAHELKPGDKLIKFDLPIIEGSKTLDKAYANGMYTADGCLTKGRHRIYLYHEKRNLKDRVDKTASWHEDDFQNRSVTHIEGLKDKFFVPDTSYTIESRLEWLAGYMDGDGTVARNGANESLQAVCAEHEFLYELQLMLQSLGVHSKVVDGMEEGRRLMPANDGTGDSKYFNCRETKRILISSSSLFKLSQLGFETYRLKWKKRLPQRNAEQFIQIVSVEDDGRRDDTYCFEEPKKHMGMFNGVLTGQCLEIALPTKPLDDINDEEGEIALCTLAAFNMGLMDISELPEVSDLAVRALDALLDYQDYPVKAAEISTMNRRSLGLGVTNFAYFLAKNGIKYSDGSANKLVHEWFEAMQFYLLKASNNLAKEKGACPSFNETKYADGSMPVDRYKKAIDSFANFPLLQDWDGLRRDVVEFGLRNSTLTALMPCETSSQITNSTNGIEPPRGYVSVKASKDGIMKQVVPDCFNLYGQYELLWDIKDNNGYLELVAIMQKFVDQAISANTNYDPRNYPGDKVPIKLVLKDMLTAYKDGVKNLYYHNTRDGQGDEEDQGCDGGGCKI